MSSAEPTWPAAPARFIGHSTSTRARIFLLRDERPPRLQAVTTIATAEAEQLIGGLNDALWHGNTAVFDRLSEKLPQAVVTACREALADCDHRVFALGYDEEPMSVLPGGQAAYSWPDRDLVEAAESAYNLGLQMLFTNEVDEHGKVWINVLVLSDESWVPMEGPVSAWPAPPGTALVERQHSHPSDALSDPRWGTHLARLHWVWRAESPDLEDGAATAEWVLEFYDARVPRQRNHATDQEEESPSEDEQLPFELGEWNPWPMTPRTRFVLYVALGVIADQLDEDVSGLREGASHWEPIQMDAFPVITRNQPAEWWEQLCKSADRLTEAMRTGVQWNPRTPGEEAVLHLAASQEAETVLDFIRDDPTSSITRQFHSLPEALVETHPDTGESWHVEDLQFDEVLGALAGDTDIELMWDLSMDGIGDPDADFRSLGMGDLRPQSWHKPFDVDHLDAPSFLHD